MGLKPPTLWIGMQTLDTPVALCWMVMSIEAALIRGLGKIEPVVISMLHSAQQI